MKFCRLIFRRLMCLKSRLEPLTSTSFLVCFAYQHDGPLQTRGDDVTLVRTIQPVHVTDDDDTPWTFQPSYFLGLLQPLLLFLMVSPHQHLLVYGWSSQTLSKPVFLIIVQQVDILTNYVMPQGCIQGCIQLLPNGHGTIITMTRLDV